MRSYLPRNMEMPKARGDLLHPKPTRQTQMARVPPSPLPVPERPLTRSTPFSNRIWSTVALSLPQSPSRSFCHALLGHANKPRTLSAPSGSLDRGKSSPPRPPSPLRRFRSPTDARRPISRPRRASSQLLRPCGPSDVETNNERNIVTYAAKPQRLFTTCCTCCTKCNNKHNVQKLTNWTKDTQETRENRGGPASPTRAHNENQGQPGRTGDNRG